MTITAERINIQLLHEKVITSGCEKVIASPCEKAIASACEKVIASVHEKMITSAHEKAITSAHEKVIASVDPGRGQSMISAERINSQLSCEKDCLCV